MGPELDTSKVEIANVSDPDHQAIKGKPIIKIVWNDKTKQPMIAFDPEQFPQMNFLSAILGMIKDDLDLKIRTIGETQIKAGFAMQMQEQAQTQQLANRIRNGR